MEVHKETLHHDWDEERLARAAEQQKAAAELRHMVVQREIKDKQALAEKQRESFAEYDRKKMKCVRG